VKKSQHLCATVLQQVETKKLRLLCPPSEHTNIAYETQLPEMKQNDKLKAGVVRSYKEHNL